ncbi:MAG: hypothetical protein CVU56_10510 [Deltaproteobacteria bacterium HGW-Deltaproteobacteria-14]|jgi:POT family proton-dependent oligopeptide transporter|nr:MAG: hypothetical protein CVU56_10510 [Deltaproteobacteria bacterium HGW-Deltaproteobacteria-14]
MEQAPTARPPDGTVFGHPAGLFTLFFAEMWERFSYYGMRALLVFYMTKGFLGYNDNKSYLVYGAYTSLVYMTPYFGGMLADYVLGARRAVVLGGLLMAAGHLLMTVENETFFFAALGLLIVGNGFFKPNISTIVGTLYPKGSPKRDGGFTLFYMGINLGAAMSPVVCGYVGETFGWHYGFGLATAGMLIGVATFVAPRRLTQLLILATALATAIAMPFWQDTVLQLAVRLILGAALLTAALVAFVALNRGGIPKWAGQPAKPERLAQKVGGLLRLDVLVYLGAVVSVPVFALLVQKNEPAAYILYATGALALAYILYEAVFRSARVERHRLFVVVILMFFSFLFWTFFEQAGTSVNNFTDRNVDRVVELRAVTQDDVGTTIQMRVAQKVTDPALADLPLLSQEQLGYQQGGQAFSMDQLSDLREAALAEGAPDSAQVFAWRVDAEQVGMGLGGGEIPASEFQAANPMFILIFGLLFTALWGWLAARGWEPSTPVKFSLGLLQLGLGFLAYWYGAQVANERGMVGVSWLLVGYLLQTTGELCLSPVGLSMVTRLSPQRMVSTVMGAWFLATAFSSKFASLIATLTGVGGEGAEEGLIPPPSETLNTYGDVFYTIAIAAGIAAVVLFALSPLLTRWMHTEVDDIEAAAKHFE